MRSLLLLSAAFLFAACTPAPSQVEPADVITEYTAADLPADVTATVLAAAPGMVISEAERKERDGRVYFDVEGARDTGDPIELDLLQTETGWQVVEIQRDIAWMEAPENVRTAAEAAPSPFEPARVIESTQTEDGAVIYELFAEGRPEAPSLEVRLVNGQASLMTQANPH